MPWIGAAVAGVGGVVSGALSGSAARKGARKADKALNKGNRAGLEILENQRADTLNQMGDFANQQAQAYAGYQDDFDSSFAQFYQDALNYGQNAPGAPSVSAPGALDTAAVDAALGRFDPYMNAGEQSLNAMLDMTGLGGGGYDFKATPGYDFRRDEGMRAVEGSAAARGGLYSGGNLRQLQDLGDQLAAQEYQAVYGRLAGQSAQGMNAANMNAQGQNQLLGTQANYDASLYGTAAGLAAQNYATDSGNYRANLNALTGLQGQYLGTQGDQLMNQQGYAHNSALMPIMVNDAYGQTIAGQRIANGQTRAGIYSGQAANSAQNYANASNALFGMAGAMYGNQPVRTQAPTQNNIVAGEWDWMGTGQSPGSLYPGMYYR